MSALWPSRGHVTERLTAVTSGDRAQPDPAPSLKALDGGARATKNRGRRVQARGGLPMLELVSETVENAVDVDAVYRGLAALLLRARARKGRAS